jgi:hypothetical protein
MSEQQTNAAATPPKIKAMTEAISLAIAQIVHDVDSGSLKGGELVERTIQNLHATISFIGLAVELAERIADAHSQAQTDGPRIQAHMDINGIPPGRERARVKGKRLGRKRRPSLRIVVNNELLGGCTP